MSLMSVPIETEWLLFKAWDNQAQPYAILHALEGVSVSQTRAIQRVDMLMGRREFVQMPGYIQISISKAVMTFSDSTLVDVATLLKRFLIPQPGPTSNFHSNYYEPIELGDILIQNTNGEPHIIFRGVTLESMNVVLAQGNDIIMSNLALVAEEIATLTKRGEEE